MISLGRLKIFKGPAQDPQGAGSRSAREGLNILKGRAQYPQGGWLKIPKGAGLRPPRNRLNHFYARRKTASGLSSWSMETLGFAIPYLYSPQLAGAQQPGW